jgi:dienelactone hydrolase
MVPYPLDVNQTSPLDTHATPRNFSPWAYWLHRLSTTTTFDNFRDLDVEDYDSWRTRCHSRLEELLGSDPERVPLRYEVVSSEEAELYRRDKVVFDCEEMMSVPAYLLVPHDRRHPGPAVLAIHGHGAGKSQVCGLADDGFSGDYAHQLARRGYVVLAPDLRCWGERADDLPSDHYACDTNLVHGVLAGVMPLAQNLWDLSRCIDVLAQHPLVDEARIGAVGFSYGATLTLFLAARDARVSAAVVASYFSSWAASHAVPLNMCGSQVLPGVLGRMEHVDLAGLIYPRPLLVETGTRDPLFPLDAALESVAQVRRLYDVTTPDALVHSVFEGEHQWSGEQVYPFFDRWL